MFQPMMPQPFPYYRGPVRVVADAAAAAIARAFDRIAAPRRNAAAEFLSSLAPYVSMFVDFMQTPTPPVPKVANANVDDIKRQLQAHEIRLNSLADLLFGDILKAAAATDDGTGHDGGHNGTVE